jgi:hypothetical protein
MKRLLLAVVSATAVCAFALPAVADPGGELVYADGQTYLMNTATLVTNASPGLLKAPPIYILGYPTAPGTSGPITLPSGYQPQCNPCSQEPVAYHDHLIPGAPGLGTNGTSGSDYKAPWRIVVMKYNPAYSNSPSFQPITNDDQLAAAEQAGEFLPINPVGPNRYEIWTPNVLICPIVRQNRG